MPGGVQNCFQQYELEKLRTKARFTISNKHYLIWLLYNFNYIEINHECFIKLGGCNGLPYVVRSDDCKDNPDYVDKCPKWAEDDYCCHPNYDIWMHDNCKKSCGCIKEPRIIMLTLISALDGQIYIVSMQIIQSG